MTMRSVAGLILLAVLAVPLSTSGETASEQTGGESARVSVKNLTCEQYAALPDDIRPLVAGWVRGFYYRESWKDAWIFDVEQARKAVAALNEACKQTPEASFRYKLNQVVKQIGLTKKQ
ncbi:MAG TPA: HdeA/HdeB family chaperone [Myxococcales bacterium]|nr:HdeA/HdeB family chaperone [Myxococcales bacterium]